MANASFVSLCGPATWNDIIVLDDLPRPAPHMQFARAAWRTVGGTSAGKALHLAGLGVETRLHAFLGDDADGRQISELLRSAGVDLVPRWSSATERHVNLMTADGRRISLYTSAPSPATARDLAEIQEDLSRAAHAVVDLSEAGAAVIEELGQLRAGTTIWVDLHDYDGGSAFHEPFVRNADVVFMNADAVDDPWELARSCVQRGPRLAVCTLGADGAIAVDETGQRLRVAAPGVDRLVDSNGAGDAFMAGFLNAHVRGADVRGCLEAGSAQAAVALSTRHLHPALDSLIET